MTASINLAFQESSLTCRQCGQRLGVMHRLKGVKFCSSLHARLFKEATDRAMIRQMLGLKEEVSVEPPPFSHPFPLTVTARKVSFGMRTEEPEALVVAVLIEHPRLTGELSLEGRTAGSSQLQENLTEVSAQPQVPWPSKPAAGSLRPAEAPLRAPIVLQPKNMPRSLAVHASCPDWSDAPDPTTSPFVPGPAALFDDIQQALAILAAGQVYSGAGFRPDSSGPVWPAAGPAAPITRDFRVLKRIALDRFIDFVLEKRDFQRDFRLFLGAELPNRFSLTPAVPLTTLVGEPPAEAELALRAAVKPRLGAAPAAGWREQRLHAVPRLRSQLTAVGAPRMARAAGAGR